MMTVALATTFACALASMAACKRNDPTPTTSETTTTSDQLQQEQQATTPPPAPPAMDESTLSGTSQHNAKLSKYAKDGGKPMSNDDPSSTTQTTGADYNQYNPPSEPVQTATPEQKKMQEPNHSTTLGDGKSGTYTDGKGTNGGKATWGTGPKKP